MLRNAVQAAKKEGQSEHPDIQKAEKKLNDYLSRLEELRDDDSWAELPESVKRAVMEMVRGYGS